MACPGTTGGTTICVLSYGTSTRTLTQRLARESNYGSRDNRSQMASLTTQVKKRLSVLMQNIFLFGISEEGQHYIPIGTMVVMPNRTVYARNDILNDTYQFGSGVWRYPQMFDKFASNPGIHGTSNYGLKQLLCSPHSPIQSFSTYLVPMCELQVSWQTVASCSKAKYGTENDPCTRGIVYKFGMDIDTLPDWSYGQDLSATRLAEKFIKSMFQRNNVSYDHETTR